MEVSRATSPPDGVANAATKLLGALTGDAVCHGHGGDAARLCHHDAAVSARAGLDVVVQDVLTHLHGRPSLVEGKDTHT